jgi:hypothetical protein
MDDVFSFGLIVRAERRGTDRSLLAGASDKLVDEA